jgi:hypothetical protein
MPSTSRRCAGGSVAAYLRWRAWLAAICSAVALGALETVVMGQEAMVEGEAGAGSDRPRGGGSTPDQLGAFLLLFEFVQVRLVLKA